MKNSGALYDSNIWVALVFPTHPLHEQATSALGAASSSEPAFFCRATELSFLRLMTTPVLQQAYQSPQFSNREALNCLHSFGKMPQVSFCEEEKETRALWQKLAALPTTSPKMWMDAYLAAQAITSKISLTTGDRDFISYEKEGLNLNLLEG